MKLSEIKAALEQGLRVMWIHHDYQVIKDSLGQYLTVYRRGTKDENAIGLTWSDGVRLNGAEDDFRIDPACIHYAVDDTGAPRLVNDMYCAYRPRVVVLKAPDYMQQEGNVHVAVWSYLPAVHVDDEQATELAIDYLLECAGHIYTDEAEAVQSVLAVL